jgi:mono/diheme cytochrome c family protein
MIAKRILSILLTGALAVVFSGALNAAEPKGNEGKGRYYFRQTCKDCHVKGAKGGEVSPLTKTMAQWKTYFTKATHNRAAEPLTKLMTPEQLRDVQTFLVAHAADSLQPETCGK